MIVSRPDAHPQLTALSEEARLLLAGDPATLRALAGASAGKILLCAHRGPSMNPTLRQQDLLEVAPYAGRPARQGDVVLCLPLGADQAVVHRIVALTPEGIRTRGDNNSRNDAWLLQPDDILGRVVAAHRRSRRRAIYGGRLGLCWALGARAVVPAKRCAGPLRHILVQAFGALSWLRPALLRVWRPRVLALGPLDRPIYRLMAGRWLAGQWDPTFRRWAIRWPYRLWVDGLTLPYPCLDWPDRVPVVDQCSGSHSPHTVIMTKSSHPISENLS